MEIFFNPQCEAILAGLPPRPHLVIQPSLEGQAARLVRGQLHGSAVRLLVVSDARTQQALGARVQVELTEHYRAEACILPDPVLPTPELVQQLAAKDVHGFVAVGSGTINDVCKAASAIAGKPYVVFPTAPSMNGYTSANASLLIDGKKQSLPAHLPLGVFCDMEVLAAAPARLIRAGLGDSLARPTAQADWLLAQFMEGAAYDERPFKLISYYEPALFAHAAGLVKGDVAAVRALMEVLLVSGLGMTLCGGSNPASQGEHAIVHNYELMTGDHSALHGEAVGVAVLTMARLQEEWLEKAPIKEHERAEIRAAMVPSSQLENMLKSVGAPMTPRELSWNELKYAEAVRTAHMTRDRFGFLNLVYG